ncbi:DUF397 domain-containing protein [Streptomyces aquilus]|uniref:DUF397 domain-containing protein n=1 Tax=Streptomyces aquilus TaxID=2548456 RepID=UPI00367955FC
MHTTHWQKSSYSGDGSNCLEISIAPTTVHVRDSKNTEGAHLAFPPSAWTSFISHSASDSNNQQP